MLVDLREAFQKNYLVREIVPIPSDTPTFETVSEYLDSEYCQAQLQLQPQLSWKLSLALISYYPTAHPPDRLVV